MMIPTSLFIEPKQEGKIKTALRKRKGCRNKTRKINGDSTQQHHFGRLSKGELLLTPAQWKKYQKAKPGSVVALPFQHRHLVENMHHKGGFLPLIAAVLAPIIGGVAGGLIEREIAGSGLKHPKMVWYKRSAGHKPSVAFQLDPAPRGNGVVFAPWYIPSREHLFKAGV